MINKADLEQLIKKGLENKNSDPAIIKKEIDDLTIEQMEDLYANAPAGHVYFIGEYWDYFIQSHTLKGGNTDNLKLSQDNIDTVEEHNALSVAVMLMNMGLTPPSNSIN